MTTRGDIWFIEIDRMPAPASQLDPCFDCARAFNTGQTMVKIQDRTAADHIQYLHEHCWEIRIGPAKGSRMPESPKRYALIIALVDMEGVDADPDIGLPAALGRVLQDHGAVPVPNVFTPDLDTVVDNIGTEYGQRRNARGEDVEYGDIEVIDLTN